MTGPVIDAPETAPDAEDGAHAATKAAVFAAAERLFALHGFQNVSVRDITAEARVNLASVNYHFGSKDSLLFEIFRRRTAELNRERARMLHEANGRHGGKPPVREILEALFAPPLRWADPAHDRRISVQFIIRARSEGTEQMRDVLQNDVSHLARFADALKAARPELPPETVYWRLHFCLGMVHNNRFVEFDRLHHLSDGLTREGDVQALLGRMLDFAEAGFPGLTMPTIVTDARRFTADRPWGARDLAEIDGASVRLHWSDQPYKWHVNDGREVFVVLDGHVDMHYREAGVEKVVRLGPADLFIAEAGDEHVARPVGEARILVVERKGSV